MAGVTSQIRLELQHMTRTIVITVWMFDSWSPGVEEWSVTAIGDPLVRLGSPDG